MRKFLDRFISKKRSIVNIFCLAASSLLFVSLPAEAMPQNAPNKTALNYLFSKPVNSTSSGWAVPSPSCFTRSACMADTNFKQEFRNFVGFIHTRYPSAHVPSAERLQRHACNSLSAGPHSANDLTDDVDVTTGQWIATFLSYSFWSTQAGVNPYPTSPVWWCFLDNASHYIVSDTLEVVGTANVIAQFNGLGQPAASGGAGFYVSQSNVTDAYPATSLEPGFFAAQTYVNKELVAIDIAAPGTTKRLAQYQALLKIQAHATYPRRTISSIQETINTIKTVEWLGLCSFLCTNCAPGSICPIAPLA